MAVRKDCSHYSSRTVHSAGPSEEAVEKCRLGVAEAMPFACPDDCVFFEERPFRGQGFEQGSTGPDA